MLGEFHPGFETGIVNLSNPSARSDDLDGLRYGLKRANRIVMFSSS